MEPPRPGKEKTKFYAQFEPIRDSDDKLVAIDTHCTNVQWRCRFDHDGLTVSDEKGTRLFPWKELPRTLHIAVAQGHAALYLHHDDIIHFPMDSRGTWSEFEAPGWFGMMLYNALLRAGCKQST
jgi:hypothetical protein